MLQKADEIVKCLINYSKTFFPLLFGIETLLNISFKFITNMWIISYGDFSQEWGRFSYFYIYFFVPITFSIILTCMIKHYSKSEKETFFTPKMNFIFIFVIAFLFIGAFISYKDYHSSRVTIISSSPLSYITLESQYSKKKYQFTHNHLKKQNENIYILPKRIHYGGYKIIIKIQSAKEILRYRTFDKRSEIIRIF